MHLEVLVEDMSGSIAVEAFLQKILEPHKGINTYRVHSYKGIGHIPANLHHHSDPQKRILLDRLPKLLQGYGRSLPSDEAAVMVILDSDRRDCLEFKRELIELLNSCTPQPKVLFRIAIEEIEAWLLGDRRAIKKAYPGAKSSVLQNYRQDSICDTWEKLADAVCEGGAQKLKKAGYPLIGVKKCEWAREIAHRVDIQKNESRSFQVFRDGVNKLIGNMTK
jgi:hypothetical protein